MSKEKIKKEKKEKSKVRIWIENILEVLIVVACLAFSIIMIASPGGVKEDYSKINVSYMPVLSNSMSGTFEKGDLIFGKKINRDDDGNCEILDIGTVAIFVVNDPSQSEYQFINTHRIVGYYYEYKDSHDGKNYAGYEKLFNVEEVSSAQTALEYAESMGWTNFTITGYITSGDNKGIYHVDGNINNPLIRPGNTDCIDSYVPDVNDVIGTWTGKKLSGVGGVITWIQKPLNFFLVIMIPLILLFLYNIWTVIKYILEVKTEKARKLALEEAQANAIDEEEIKRKAVEEYMKKMGIDPSSLPTENKESDVKEESNKEEVTSLEVKEEENSPVIEEKVEEPVVKKAPTKKKTTTSSSTKKTTTTTKKSTGTKKTTSSSKKTTSKKSSEVK